MTNRDNLRTRLDAMVCKEIVRYQEDHPDGWLPDDVALRYVALDLLQRIDELEECIPTTWLDPLLTGPKAVIGEPPYDCRDIENLLQAIRARAALKASSPLPGSTEVE